MLRRVRRRHAGPRVRRLGLSAAAFGFKDTDVRVDGTALTITAPNRDLQRGALPVRLTAEDGAR